MQDKLKQVQDKKKKREVVYANETASETKEEHALTVSLSYRCSLHVHVADIS